MPCKGSARRCRNAFLHARFMLAKGGGARGCSGIDAWGSAKAATRLAAWAIAIERRGSGGAASRSPRSTYVISATRVSASCTDNTADAALVEAVRAGGSVHEWWAMLDRGTHFLRTCSGRRAYARYVRAECSCDRVLYNINKPARRRG